MPFIIIHTPLTVQRTIQLVKWFGAAHYPNFSPSLLPSSTLTTKLSPTSKLVVSSSPSTPCHHSPSQATYMESLIKLVFRGWRNLETPISGPLKIDTCSPLVINAKSIKT